MTDDQQVRRIIRQNLQMDQLLGLSEIPVPRATIAALRARPMVQPSPPTGASATPDDASQQPTAVRPASGRPAAAPPHAKAESITGDEERAARLRVMDHDHVRDCQKCSLAQTRTNTVFGQGSASARLVFVGEAPGFDEDRQGLAFVGRAGKLLTRMIQAMNLTREEVFICNVLKCRPPDNRDPAPDEVSACSPYLMQQLEIIRPEVIVALGAPAARTLLRTTDGIGRLRGRFHDFYIDGPLGGDPTPLMPTYHPAYLLRSPQQKAKSWADLQQVMTKLGLGQ